MPVSQGSVCLMNARLDIDKELDFKLLQQAADWFAVLQSDSVTQSEYEQWRKWVEATPQQSEAWQRVESISQQFKEIPLSPSQQVLDRPKLRRRNALKMLLLVTAVGGASWQLLQSRSWKAEYRTARGDVQLFELSDHSKIWLNTGSAMDVDFNNKQRVIRFYKGEIHIQTAKGSVLDNRPFIVETEFARLRALGTEFMVRQKEGGMALSVLQGKVEISLNNKEFSKVITAGQQVYFSEKTIDKINKLTQTLNWNKGVLSVDNMLLGDFVDELNRYFIGYINCSPEVANFRLVGSYPLQNISAILMAIQQSLPVKVNTSLPWWVSIETI